MGRRDSSLLFDICFAHVNVRASIEARLERVAADFSGSTCGVCLYDRAILRGGLFEKHRKKTIARSFNG